MSLSPSLFVSAAIVTFYLLMSSENFVLATAATASNEWGGVGVRGSKIHNNNKQYAPEILSSPPNSRNSVHHFEEINSPQRSLSFVGQACRPRHVHLSVGRNQNATHSSMIVSFSFPPKCRTIYSRSCPGCQTISIGAIIIGDDPNDMSTLVLAEGDSIMSYNASLTREQMKHSREGDRYFSDTYYHIEVNDLKPGTRYHYKCLLLKENHADPPEDEGGDKKSAIQRYESSIEVEEVDVDNEDASKRRLTQHSSGGIQSENSVYTTNRGLSGFQVISRTNVTTFLTPPAPGEWYPPPLDRSIKFAVLGDLGAYPHSRETVSKLEHNWVDHKINDDEIPEIRSEDLSAEDYHLRHGQGIDCILLAGDISYTNGDHSVWDDWLDMMSEFDFFKSVPLQIALGNHDLDYDPDTLDYALAYEHRFRMPQVQPAIRDLAPHELFHHHNDFKQAKDFLPYEYGNAYYSFTFGPSKHIVLSSYSSFLPGSTQYDWLLSELDSIDRSITPWVIVMLHCPLYSTFQIHQKEMYTTEALSHLEPILLQHVVNFVIAGHIHSYMRSVPTANFSPNPRGPIYIIQGNGGRNANEAYLNPTQEEWVHVRDHSMYGYGTLDLINVTHAKWHWIKTGFTADDEEKKVRFEPDFSLHDDVWVENQWFVAEDEELVDEDGSN
eukprot:CAMPEP_0171335206 /NCGR_PEP_ID=MMETSP0878-20121228/5183_1 /TAXON_ID=67004 /ORGANISM="Thalassiosira weissflogii, Strain CCMP1336" /LENGTH=664 /DNA_ID=CAMNT_0011836437 /DNA_START=210 /DNA_END=2204 /DNA_ORIENTATION=-